MSPEIALLNETWEIVRSNLPPKERVAIADALVRAFDEHVGMDEISEYINEFDSAMKAALLDYYGEIEDEDEDW